MFQDGENDENEADEDVALRRAFRTLSRDISDIQDEIGASARRYSGKPLNTFCVPNTLGVRVCPPSQLESCGNPSTTMSKGDNQIQVQCRHCLYGEDIIRQESVGKFIA